MGTETVELLNRLLERIELLERRIELLEESWDEYYESQQQETGGLL